MAAQYEEDPGAAEQIGRLIGGMLDEILPAIANDAKRYVPILTGELRSEIGHDRPEPTRGRVYANTEYAAAVEGGWTTRSGSHVPAQPFLRPAAYKHRGSTS